MAAQLRRNDPDGLIPVTIGDMASTRGRRVQSRLPDLQHPGNLRTQAEQVVCFRNAAWHLRPADASHRVVGPTDSPYAARPTRRPFDVSERHLGMDTYDLVTQQGTSHHHTHGPDGSIRCSGTTNFRYVWPAECDLMAQLAGVEFESRVADWSGAQFTDDSTSHISVWRRPT